MRLFFSLPVPPEIRAGLEVVQRELKELDSEGMLRFVNPDLFHITVKFLGEIDESEISLFIEVGKKVASYHPKMKISCRGIDGFPDRGSKLGVLYCNVNQITTLQYAIKQEAGLEFKQSNDIHMPEGYNSHITLARGKANARWEPFEPFGPLDARRDVGEWNATHLGLVESRLNEEPRYRIVEQFELTPVGWDLYKARFPDVQFPSNW